MLEVFDLNRRKTAILQFAFDKIETEEINGVPTFQFSLPSDDKKNEYCKPFHYVRYNKGQLYRIIAPATTEEETGVKTYQCEHVIATLIDDVLFGQYVVGNKGTYTADVIEFILEKQTVKNWVLDACDFKRQFEYAFENENLLAALFSIPNRFTEQYMWSFNTTTYPWRLSLRSIDTNTAPQFYIRAKKNLLSFAEEKAAKEICTKLYCLGYGEGVNQLTIASANNGVPYLLAPQSVINEYGLITRILVDRRFEDAASLKAYGQACLEELQSPTCAKSFSVADLYELTNDDLDKAEIGKIAKFTGDGTKTFITGITRNHDIVGDMQITLATKAVDVASTIADLADRQRIEQVYSQGATQIYAQSIQANATTGIKAKLNFYIPAEMRIVNAVKAKINLSPFRSYSNVTSGGGSTTATSSAGGSTTVTSSSGGGTTVTSGGGGATTITSSSGGSTSVTSGSGGSTSVTSSSGGGAYVSSEYGGYSSRSTASGGYNQKNTYSEYGSSSSYNGYTGSASGTGSHKHYLGLHHHTFTLDNHTHSFEVPSHYHNVSIGSHSHTVSIGNHSHTVSIGNHSHTVKTESHTHSVTISAHTHSITIPNHTHSIVQGIFTFGSPSAASLYIDGVYKREVERDTEMDITAYLTGNDGKIARGAWHSIEVKPNALAYVTIDMMIQGFIQSRGGTTV